MNRQTDQPDGSCTSRVGDCYRHDGTEPLAQPADEKAASGKQPGSEGVIIPIAMDFCQSCQVGINTPEAYERLIHDATRGDSTYFTRWDEVALAWQYVDRIAAAWKQSAEDLAFYPAGSWGPERASQLLQKDGFKWWPINGQHEGEVDWVNEPKAPALTPK